MSRSWLYLALGSVCAVAACSDQGQAPPTAPEFKAVASPYPNCDFGTVKNLINSYFQSPNQQTALGYESLMEGADSVIVRTNGFKIMDLTGQVSRSASPGSTTTGSSLTKALTKCMFDTSQPAYTNLDAVAFDKALSPATGGVYYVVGQDYDIAQGLPNILKGKIGATYGGTGNYTPTTGTIKSAVGPATLSGTDYVLGNSWKDVLSGNTSEQGRALVYGYQSSTSTDPLAYEWATIDPGTNFSPYALVSICEGTVTTLMVRESGVGVLAFSTADLCNTNDATGTATGFRSNFSNKSVVTLSLSYKPGSVPPSTWNISKQPFPVALYVSSSGDGVFGVCVYLTATNNNGQFTNVTSDLAGGGQDPRCQNPPVSGVPFLSVVTTATSSVNQTLADFGKISMTKTGGLTLTFTGDVINRDGSGSLVTKINVKP